MSCIYIVQIIKNKNYIYIPVLLMSIIEILVSQSRISFIAVLATIIIAIFYYCQERKKKTVAVITIMALGIIFLFLTKFSNLTFLQRFKNLDIENSLNTFKVAWDNADYSYYQETKNIKYAEGIFDLSNDLSYIFRISKWATLLKETLKSPLVGLGPSVVGEGIDGNFVRILCETGIAGILVWIILTLYIVRKSWINKKYINYNYIFFIIINLSIIALFIDIFEASKIMPILWLVLGNALAESDKKNNNIKIVHVLSGVDFGGVESVLYNYFSKIENKKFDNIIISHDEINKENAKMFENIGFKLYKVTPKRKSLIKNFIELKGIISKEQPDVLHVHMTSSSYMALIVGCICNINIRVCHSHLSFPKKRLKDKLYNGLCKIFANVYMACSEDASRYLFGDKDTNKKKVIILKNAIQMDKFRYNENMRNELRHNLKLEGKFIIGNIGRFTEQKNQKRILEIFEEIHKKDKESVLLLIGDGEDKEDIINIAKEKGIFKNIIFLSAITDIQNYYQIMDVFLFPSLYEGLGIVLVEAQVSGLFCIASDVVPKEVKVSDNIEFISLNSENRLWSDAILKHKNCQRTVDTAEMEKSDYNLDIQAEKLEKIYYDLIEK